MVIPLRGKDWAGGGADGAEVQHAAAALPQGCHPPGLGEDERLAGGGRRRRLSALDGGLEGVLPVRAVGLNAGLLLVQLGVARVLEGGVVGGEARVEESAVGEEEDRLLGGGQDQALFAARTAGLSPACAVCGSTSSGLPAERDTLGLLLDCLLRGSDAHHIRRPVTLQHLRVSQPQPIRECVMGITVQVDLLVIFCRLAVHSFGFLPLGRYGPSSLHHMSYRSAAMLVERAVLMRVETVEMPGAAGLGPSRSLSEAGEASSSSLGLREHQTKS